MKFSERWLREWYDPAVDTQTLVNQLTSAGLEVDSVERVAQCLDGVLVGRVIEATPHPDADSLVMCRVDVGAGGTLDIACGASNARAGLMTAVATPGARLPGGVKIRRSKIRGQVSEGMLCSAVELGLGEDASGLLELDSTCAPGTPVRDALGLDDVIIDVDLTPNRGDCLCVEGIARDVAAVNGERLVPMEVEAVESITEARFPVRLDVPQVCPRYVGRDIRGIDASARTPLWMVEKLRRCGVRSLGPVVDVTNFVMLELGHPMHAFDLQRLSGEVQVRLARDEEELELLDGSRQRLRGDDLVIADANGAVALAGVMGGMHTAVRDDTQDVFLECAWFEPRGIAATCRRLGLHTDASHRFERHVNAHGQRRAVERATSLLLAIVGGEAGPVVDTAVPQSLPTSSTLTLRPTRIRRLLGVDVDRAEVERILENLHMQVAEGEGGAWQVTPPPHRPDIDIEADLVEEIARIRGLDTIPDTPPVATLDVRPAPESRARVADLRRTLVARGYQEAITYSFVDGTLQQRMENRATPLALANPISSDMAVMRTSLMPGLLQTALYNFNRQQQRVRLFETGLVFRDEGEGLCQPGRVGGIAMGEAEPRQWGTQRRGVDFFDVKADVLALCGPAGAELRFEPDEHPALHPGQGARVLRAEQCIGVMGVIHPELARRFKLAAPAVLFELDLEAVLTRHVPRFRDFSRQPAVMRDLSVTVAESVSGHDVLTCVGQAAGDMLQNLELFDVYRGEGIDSGQKSLTLSLTFQAPSRTLDEAEVEAFMSAILDALTTDLGATLRG